MFFFKKKRVLGFVRKWLACAINIPFMKLIIKGNEGKKTYLECFKRLPQGSWNFHAVI